MEIVMYLYQEKVMADIGGAHSAGRGYTLGLLSISYYVLFFLATHPKK